MSYRPLERTGDGGMRSLHRFPLVDRNGKYDEFREILDHPCVLEPHDDRTDDCVSVPVRSVVSAIAGPAVELGPFTLDTPEIVKLYNALARHIQRFPGEFSMIVTEKR